MATHCSILVWKIPWTEDPGGLQSMGSQRVRHNSVGMHRGSDYTSTPSQKCMPLAKKRTHNKNIWVGGERTLHLICFFLHLYCELHL